MEGLGEKALAVYAAAVERHNQSLTADAPPVEVATASKYDPSQVFNWLAARVDSMTSIEMVKCLYYDYFEEQWSPALSITPLPLKELADGEALILTVKNAMPCVQVGAATCIAPQETTASTSLGVSTVCGLSAQNQLGQGDPFMGGMRILRDATTAMSDLASFMTRAIRLVWTVNSQSEDTSVDAFLEHEALSADVSNMVACVQSLRDHGAPITTPGFRPNGAYSVSRSALAQAIADAHGPFDQGVDFAG